jgi:hypothetical protein
LVGSGAFASGAGVCVDSTAAGGSDDAGGVGACSGGGGELAQPNVAAKRPALRMDR